MKQEKSLFWLSMLMLLFGDIFYFGSLIFRKFMINIVMMTSTEYDATQLSSAGESTILFLSSLLGAIFYLLGFFLLALRKTENSERRKYIQYGLLLWFSTDSFVSIVFGFVWNIVLNIGFLAIFLIMLYIIED